MFKLKFLMVLVCVFSCEHLFARTITLNGKDISSVKNQKLKNVDVTIGPQGEVLIEGKHYEAIEQSSYLPITTQKKAVVTPEHKPVQEKPKDTKPEPAKTETTIENSGSAAAPASKSVP